MNRKSFDCIIVGGGVAGLSLSILLAKQQRSVLLIEKKSYPYHKVCGEYISLESYQFLNSLGLDLEGMNLPIISEFNLSSVDGRRIHHPLDLGGFGLSRFHLDHQLFNLAEKQGVTVLQETTMFSHTFDGQLFTVKTNNGEYVSKVLCASFGKHAFGNFYKPSKPQENWVGIKYHIQIDIPKNEISLHNFEGGYCGISAIENDSYCLCYLVKSSQLKKYHNDIKSFEKNVMWKNPYLNQLFSRAVFKFEKPITVSNVTFTNKQPVHDHVFYLGDAAGTIAPLSGNGMSMAMHASKLLAEELDAFYLNEKTRNEVEQAYVKKWNHQFKSRISTGRILQTLFCNPNLTSIFIRIISYSKFVQRLIIKRTHGQPF